MTDAMKKVLIVEDDARQRVALQASFVQEHYQIITASNGRDGLEILNTTTPDIILLDLMMPVLDGFAFLDAIKKDDLFKNIPVIILTNLGTQERLTHLINSSCNYFFTKTNTSLKEIVAKTRETLINPSC